MMDVEQDRALREAFLLLCVSGLCMKEAALIRDAMGSEKALLTATEGQLKEAGLTRKSAERITTSRRNREHLVEEEKAARFGATPLFFGFPGYPVRLGETRYAPAVLFTLGTLAADNGHDLAIVGSRRCSPEGRRLAENYGRAMAASGIRGVSGMARGIDGSAMRGCLDGGGSVIGVLGCGLDQIYPPENRRLYFDTACRGAVVSEFPLGTPPHKKNFPRRNRIISGLSIGLLVMEASEKSGSLITVEHALDQNRTVMAIPGPVGPAFYRGSNMLIRDGACVVLEPADIHAALNLPRIDHEGAAPDPNPSSTDPMDLILETCRHEALTVESLVARTRLPFGEMLSRVSRLETEGWIERVPGARFICKRSPYRYRAKA